MGKRNERRARAGGAPRSTRREIAAALPAPVFFITALLLFFFMTLPVSEEWGLNYYNLKSEGFSARPMVTSVVCAALLCLVSLTYMLFGGRAKNKLAARLLCSALCALFCMGALTAACSLLTETGAAGHVIGPAPVLCIVLPLFAILNAAFCELFAL